MAFYERKNTNNLSLGGVRLWVNELLDSSASPAKYSGFVDLGCVEEAPLTNDVEYQEHYCTATGTRLKDRKIVKTINSSITCTLIEPEVENLRLFLMGGDITSVAAAAGGGTVTDEVIKMDGTNRKILKFGKNAVIPSNGVTPYGVGSAYTLNTDYTVETYFGFTAIRRVPGGGISDGAYVKVDYTYDILASKDFNPATNILKECQVKFTFASDNGNELLAEFDKCNISPSGALNFANNDWTTFQLLIDILDNSDNAPSAPFGTVHCLGTGQNI